MNDVVRTSLKRKIFVLLLKSTIIRLRQKKSKMTRNIFDQNRFVLVGFITCIPSLMKSRFRHSFSAFAHNLLSFVKTENIFQLTWTPWIKALLIIILLNNPTYGDMRGGLISVNDQKKKTNPIENYILCSVWF